MTFVRLAVILNKHCCSGSAPEGIIKSYGLFWLAVLKIAVPELEL